jgi:hypothetical protein
VLVGGYARAEGGVIRTADGWRAHNDYDLVASVVGSPRCARGALEEVARACAADVGVEVDLWPIAPSTLDAPPPTLFWLDASLGSARLLHGKAGRLSGLSVKTRDVSLEEGSRLLANRAVGVALSRLAFECGDDVDSAPLVVARHVHKAVLAAGDALLLAADLYAPSVAARADALAMLSSAPHVGDDH